MKTNFLFVVISLFLFSSLNSSLYAQAGSLRKAAIELTEAILKTGGKDSATELAEFGGEVAVKETLEKAAKEGGEDLVQAVVNYSKVYGLDGLKAVAEDPKLMTKALDSLPTNLRLRAVTEASRAPKLMTQLVQKNGDEALQVAARHPGIGADVVKNFGDAGIAVGRTLSTDDLILLARKSNDFSRLPEKSKSTFLEILKENPKVVLTYLAGGTAVALTVDAVEDIKEITIGTPDTPGPIIKPIVFWIWLLPLVLISAGLIYFLPNYITKYRKKKTGNTTTSE